MKLVVGRYFNQKTKKLEGVNFFTHIIQGLLGYNLVIT